MTRLLAHLGSPHKAYKSVHVAGTNGKGSTIAFLSSILTEAAITNGRFTSPHMLLYNDCITINNKTYPMDKFEQVKLLVEAQNAAHGVGCTEFEMLTCAAFKIFQMEQVLLALIEVGLGGASDATNVLEPLGSDGTKEGGVVVSAITKIGIDHESFLGTTIGEIAGVKAGIIKRKTPCVVDGTNLPEAVDAIKKAGGEQEAPVQFVHSNEHIQELLRKSLLRGAYQGENLAVALGVLDVLSNGHIDRIAPETVERGVARTLWPGRLQQVKDAESGVEFLLDGAHNESAAIELGRYLLSLNSHSNGTVFVVAVTRGKSIAKLLKHITVRERDTIIPATFVPPREMPWIESYLEAEIASVAREYVNDVREAPSGGISDILPFLRQMRHDSDSRPCVVCGSLYLCSNVLNGIARTRTCYTDQ